MLHLIDSFALKHTISFAIKSSIPPPKSSLVAVNLLTAISAFALLPNDSNKTKMDCSFL